MKVITLLNEKGGVGKTTLSVHIAAGLAARGARVMLIDSDPQGHATLMTGLQKSPGLYELLVRNANWKDVVEIISPERYGGTDGLLAVVPSNVESRTISDAIQDIAIFAKRMAGLQQSRMVDYVIVDTPPTPSLLHGTIYLGTDATIYPTKTESLSMDGLKESLTRLKMARDNRRMAGYAGIDVLAVIPNMVRAGVAEHEANLDLLRKMKLPDSDEPIPVIGEIRQRTVWSETATDHIPIWMIEPASPAVAELSIIVDHVEAYAYAQ